MTIVKDQIQHETARLSQEQMPLFDALVAYAKQDVTPFDVPGHKMGAQMNPLKKALGEMAMRMDVNSMKELDLWSHPQSVIKEAQTLAAQAFGADHAFFLVNGTTIGIHAMIMATCQPGETILVPRNAHKSVMDAIILSGSKPVMIQPEVDYYFGISHNVSVRHVAQALIDNPNAKALLITYPTYFGSMTDLRSICKVAHEKGVLVLVDSAHGAHLRFLSENMVDPIAAGADIVTMSMHKTGGSLTQSSLLLVNQRRMDPQKVQKMLRMLQTTSANYLLMSSIDVARRELALYGKERYSVLKPIVEEAIEQIETHSRYKVLTSQYVKDQFNQTFDWTKLVVRVNGIGLTGFEVYSLLKKHYGIQMELAEGYVVMAVITSSDSRESIQRLVDALKDIEKTYGKQATMISMHVTNEHTNRLCMMPREAFYSEHESVKLTEAVGRISADTLMIYPPGIPLVIPGEVISENVVRQYQYYQQSFGKVLTDAKVANHITVVKENDEKWV